MPLPVNSDNDPLVTVMSSMTKSVTAFENAIETNVKASFVKAPDEEERMTFGRTLSNV